MKTPTDQDKKACGGDQAELGPGPSRRLRKCGGGHDTRGTASRGGVARDEKPRGALGSGPKSGKRDDL